MGRPTAIIMYLPKNPLLQQLKHTLAQHQARCPTSTLTAQAAVLLIISDEPTPRLLFSRRSQTLKQHAGEVSLVGGKKDDSDVDIFYTALREAQEEIALKPSDVHILGVLPLQQSKNKTQVCSIVATIGQHTIAQLQPSEHEIARLFWVSLHHFIVNLPSDQLFLVDNQHRTHHPSQPPNTPICHHLHTPAWVVDNETIWGLTGRILASFLDIAFGISIHWYYQLTSPSPSQPAIDNPKHQ